jgi:hypothetical protein
MPPPPEDPSSLSLLPPPSPLPGEGNPVGAIVLVGCALRTFEDGYGAHSAPYKQHRLWSVPFSRKGGGRREKGQG